MQWLSLCLLTIGCMLKQLHFLEPVVSADHEATKTDNGSAFSINIVLLLIQTICSCSAGVYNEYLLKNQGSDVNIYVQNMFMYVDSIICNLFILTIEGDVVDAFTVNSFKSILRFKVILIIFNNAAIGIVTSLFLKYMNSILKTFAGALELMFTAVLCYLLFAIPIYMNTVLAIGVVSVAVYIYSQNPVVNVISSSAIKESSNSEHKKLLLNDNQENV